MTLVSTTSTLSSTGYAEGAWPWVGLVLLLLMAAAVTWVLALLWTTRLIHLPPRLTPPRALARLGRSSPADLGLAYEAQDFEVRDSANAVTNRPLAVAGWWIAAPHDRPERGSCILLHGYGDARSGALAWAPVWHAAGFNLLLPDLRAHGDSGGTHSGGGVWERDDVHHLIEALRAARPTETETLVLAGISFGGLVASAVAAERDDLAAVVLDSPIASWPDATRRWGDLFSLPPPGATKLRFRLAQWLHRLDFSETIVATTLPRITAPLLLILPQHDVFMSGEEAEHLADLAAAREGALTHLWKPDATHNAALPTEPGEYARKVEDFLEAALPGVARASVR